MREIKFRVWDNVDYMSGSFSLMDIQDRNIGFTDECKVMQYTGLKDCNGVEIYEGDIIRVFNNNNGYFKVIFENSYNGGWVLKYKDEKHLSLGARKSIEVEVIGNIYES